MSLINSKQFNQPVNITGSLYGTASYAITASYALNGGSGGSGAGFPYSGSAVITGSLLVSGSGLNVLGNVIITGSQYINGSIYIPDGVNSIYFSGSNAASRLVWNNTDGTLDLGLKGGNVTLQVGQESVIRVVNKTGADLLEADYKVVRSRLTSEGGAQGQRLAVVLAQATSDLNSATTLGIVTETIANNQEGYITNSGNINGINTTGALQGETWVDGDILYLSPTVAGGITNIKPHAPNHMVVLGYVVYAHQNNGKIFVKVDNGYELDELHNININTGSLTSGDLLVYNSGSGYWTNTKQLTGSYGLTGSLNINGYSIITSNLTGSFVVNSQTSSFVLNSVTSSMLSPYVLTSVTSSMLSPYVLTSVTASMSVSSARSASYVNTLTQTVTITGSGALLSISADTFIFTGSMYVSGTINVVGSITGSLYGTSSWALNAVTAPNYVLTSVTSSMLSPYVLTSVTSSMLQPYTLNSVTSSMLSPYVLTSVTSSMTVYSSSFASTATYIDGGFY